MTATLFEVDGLGREFQVGPSATIGRDPGSHICLTEPTVSRKHAEVRRREDGQYEVVDLKSRHGTFVSSRRVESAVLANGDLLTVGSVRLRFKEEAAAAPTAPSPRVERRLDLAAEPRLRPAAEIPSEKELRREYEKLRAGLELMGAGLDLPTFLRRLLETAFLLVDAQRGAIVLIDPATSASSLHIARNRNGEVVDLQVPSTILCEVMARKSGVVTVDAEGDERFGPSDSICRQEIRSALCIPVLHRGEVLGVMHLDSPVIGN